MVLSSLTIKKTNGDEKIYTRYRLNKDKRGIADYPTSYFHSSAPSYSQVGYAPSNAGYSLSSGIQSFPGFGGFGGSLGHGLQLTSSSPSTANFGSSLGYGFNLGSGSEHGFSLGGLSLGDQNGFLASSQPKTGPVTFGVQAEGSAAPNRAYSSPPVYSGLHQMSSFGAGQGSAYSFPLIRGPSQGSTYSFPASFDTSGSHGLTSASLGSGGSPTYNVPLSSSHQPNSGGYLMSAASLGSSKYNFPVSSSSIGYNALSADPSHGAATYSTQAGVSSGSSSSIYTQPISYSNSNSKLGSSAYSKYTPASSEGSAYAGSDSSSNVPSTSYSSPITSYGSPSSSHNFQSASYSSPNSYSSPSITYSGSSQTQSANNPSYSSSGTSYQLPSSSYASPSSSQLAATINTASTKYNAPSISYSGASSNYLNPTASYSSPSVTYAGADSSYSGSSIGYSNPSSSQNDQGEQTGAYSKTSSRFLRYPAPKSAANRESDLSKYDTISYSSPTGL